MSANEHDVDDVRQAYHVLGVSTDSSALAIKQAYRQLVKRWHPDLYAPGTAAYDEAVEMTQTINEAYATAARAPLRYYCEASSPPPARPAPPAEKPPDDRPEASSPAVGPLDMNFPPFNDRIEFWVRFVCGALVGALLSFQLLLLAWDVPSNPTNWTIEGIASTCLIAGFGLGSARQGDRFWRRIFVRWWRWP